MTIFEILLIGVGLSMDAVAVTMTNGMVYRALSKPKCILMPVFFGAFQGLMPLAGYFAGGLFAEIISKYASVVVLVILCFIGGKMLKEGFCRGRKGHSEMASPCNLSLSTLVLQAIATSIDALAVGVGFSAVRVDIAPAVLLIAATTAFLTVLALLIGRTFGDILGSKAEILGGIVLIIIGIKAVL